MAKESGLSKKVGPLSTGAWIGVGAAAIGVLYVYRRRSAANAAATGAQGITGGNLPLGLIPSGSTDTTQASTSSSQFASLDQWQAALLQALYKTPEVKNQAISNAGAYNAVSRWSNGQCVGPQQFSALSRVLPTIGLPPGFSAPPLTICTNAAGQQISYQQAQPTATGH